jgi:hypothetical protein
VLFIAMRFVAGGDLRGVLDREGPLAPGRAAGFLSPVASALDAAHRAGLVHRDVKPANILVDAREDRPDHVYLTDFGVSKGAVASVSLTGTGQFLGTPEYAAPEQVQGGAVDGQADQYALACVAWKLLTGSAPFERDQGLAVLLAHLSEPPPLLGSRRPDLPAAAGEVLARALAKAPQDRYGSCRDFADALRAAAGLPSYASPRSAPAHLATEISARPVSAGPVPAGTAGGFADALPATLTTAGQIPATQPGTRAAGADGPGPQDAVTQSSPGPDTAQVAPRRTSVFPLLPHAKWAIAGVAIGIAVFLIVQPVIGIGLIAFSIAVPLLSWRALDESQRRRLREIQRRRRALP